MTTQRLPIPGSDDGTWGDILNGFLEVSLNSDGTLNPTAVATAGAELTSHKGAASGYAPLNSSSLVPTTNLGTGTASSSNYLRGDGTWVTPNSGSSTLASDTDVAIVSPANNQVLTYNSGASKWENENPLITSVTVNGGSAQTGAVAVSAVQIGGDLGGTTTSPTVAKLQGTTLSAPTGGSTSFLNATGAWSTPSGTGSSNATTTTPGLIELAGDFSNTSTATNPIVTTSNSIPIVTTTGTQTLTNKSISGSQITSAVANATTATTASTVTTNANLTGDVTSVGNATTLAKLQGTTLSTPTGGATSYLNATGGWSTPSGTAASNATYTTPGLVELAGDLGGGTAGSATAPQVTSTHLSSALPVSQGGTGAATLTGVVVGSGTTALTTVTAPSGAIVGISDTQSLTNKNLTSGTNTFPTFNQNTTGNAATATTATSATTATAANALNSATTSVVVNGATAPSNGQVLTASNGSTAAWVTPTSAPVSSVFTRVGAVVAASGDYTAAQVTNAADKSSASAQTFTGNLSAPVHIATGLTGATAASRYVGATTSGAPASGTFVVGDFVIDQTAKVWVCTIAGSPGTWTQITSSNGGVTTFNTRSGAVTPTTGDYTAAQVTGALVSTNNLSDVSDAGSSRANLHVPALTPAAVVVTANVASLSGLNTYDGYTLTASDLVLLTAQSTASQNGLWTAASGSWTRPTEFASGATIKGRTVAVINGTTYANTMWTLDAPTTGLIIDAASQTWVQTNRGYNDGRYAQTSASVASFNTRVGAVVPVSGDYTVSQVTGAAPLASPTFTGTVTIPGATSSGVVAMGTNKITGLANGSASTDAAAFGQLTAASGNNVVTETSSYSANNGDVVLANATTAAFTVNSPIAATSAIVTIKKIDSSANAVTFSPATGMVEGAASYLLTNQYDAFTFRCDGTNWWTF